MLEGAKQSIIAYGGVFDFIPVLTFTPGITISSFNIVKCAYYNRGYSLDITISLTDITVTGSAFMSEVYIALPTTFSISADYASTMSVQGYTGTGWVEDPFLYITPSTSGAEIKAVMDSSALISGVGNKLIITGSIWG